LPYRDVATLKIYDGDVEAATFWLRKMLADARLEVRSDLKLAWPAVIARARKPDERRKTT
jgi:hypothetical protein